MTAARQFWGKYRGTVVNNGATLQVVPGLNITEPLILNNNGFGNFGALRFIDVTPGVTETTTWTGNINFNANSSWAGVDGGGANPDRLILAGTTVSGGAALVVKTGAGELEFGGNTDNVGNRDSNMRLSRQRAEAVTSYLVSRGFERNKFDVVGHGPDKPVAGNDTEEGRARNRRTDFEVIPR